MSDVIQIQNLTAGYEKHTVLNGLSLNVRQGEIFGFLGPNGAGKSTTIKAILGLIQASSGQVLLHGLPPSRIESRQKVGFLPEESAYYRFLTAVEILHFYGSLFGIKKSVLKKRVPELLERVGLSECRHKRLGAYSKGMLQKVSLAQALVNDPETLVLDEPTSGLDPIARMELRKILKDLKTAGRTIFFSSHELSEVELLCDSIAVIESGRLVKSGPLAEVLGGARGQNLELFFLETIRGARA